MNARASMFVSVLALLLWGCGGSGVPADERNEDALSGKRSGAASAAGLGDGPRLSAGERHTCAIQRTGAVVCWGMNEHGESDAPTGEFTQVVGGKDDTSRGHSCALKKSDGNPVCWGYLAFWHPPQGGFIQLAAGMDATCAVRTDGTTTCWGDNRPKDPPTGVTQISLGSTISYALTTAGTLETFGALPNIRLPTLPSEKLTQVDAGQGLHGCGLTTSGAAVCWGSRGNAYGEETPPSRKFIQVTAGLDFSCGVTTERDIACWGTNAFQVTTPPEGKFREIAAGEYHVCAVTEAGIVKCWGRNSEHQLDVPQMAPLY